MQNPSNDTRRAAAQNIEPDADSILTLQALQTQSPHSSPQLAQQRSLLSYPPLPLHVDELTQQQWTEEKSLKLDWWLWYIEQEFGRLV